MSSGSCSSSGVASSLTSSSPSSPAASPWLLGPGAPSTVTEPGGRRRAAAEREPTSGSSARKRSSRVPAAELGTRSCVGDAPAAGRPVGGHERAEQDGDPDDDEAVGEVEGGPVAKVEEVRHVAEAHPVGEVGDAAADEESHGDGQKRVP